MRVAVAAIPLLALMTVSCAEQRAAWAVAHAEIHGFPPLSHADLVVIARLVGHTTSDPMIIFQRTYRVRGRERVIVVCRLQFGGASAYTVEKAGSSWHIVTAGEMIE